jgi:putative zinc finger/helix-turn-helix YgiT family protein
MENKDAVNEFCPFCEYEKTTRQVVSKTYSYKGREQEFQGVVTHRCERCQEGYLDPAENKDLDRRLAEFYARVDGVLTPSEIKRARKALGFTQERFAEALGVGRKNFAKYERGTMRPSKNTSHLIRILYNNPGMLQYVTSGGLTPEDRSDGSAAASPP